MSDPNEYFYINTDVEILTGEQAKYIGVEVAGPYKPDQYRY